MIRGRIKTNTPIEDKLIAPVGSPDGSVASPKKGDFYYTWRDYNYSLGIARPIGAAVENVPYTNPVGTGVVRTYDNTGTTPYRLIVEQLEDGSYTNNIYYHNTGVDGNFTNTTLYKSFGNSKDSDFIKVENFFLFNAGLFVALSSSHGLIFYRYDTIIGTISSRKGSDYKIALDEHGDDIEVVVCREGGADHYHTTLQEANLTLVASTSVLNKDNVTSICDGWLSHDIIYTKADGIYGMNYETFGTESKVIAGASDYTCIGNDFCLRVVGKDFYIYKTSDYTQVLSYNVEQVYARDYTGFRGFVCGEGVKYGTVDVCYIGEYTGSGGLSYLVEDYVRFDVDSGQKIDTDYISLPGQSVGWHLPTNCILNSHIATWLILDEGVAFPSDPWGWATGFFAGYNVATAASNTPPQLNSDLEQKILHIVVSTNPLITKQINI